MNVRHPAYQTEPFILAICLITLRIPVHPGNQILVRVRKLLKNERFRDTIWWMKKIWKHHKINDILICWHAFSLYTKAHIKFTSDSPMFFVAIVSSSHAFNTILFIAFITVSTIKTCINETTNSTIVSHFEFCHLVPDLIMNKGKYFMT